MSKLTLNLEALSVETFTPTPNLAGAEAGFILGPSKHSCIEQCTTSCVP
ncbi:MAG TPA: hypothetical protein VEX86_12195 [Longimicrobium sp.]|nr:hypothetical protein [Longimicrobium sp.]